MRRTTVIGTASAGSILLVTALVAEQQADVYAAGEVARDVCGALSGGPQSVTELPVRGLGQQARDHLEYLATLRHEYRCTTRRSPFPDSWTEQAVEVRTSDSNVAIGLRVTYDLVARAPTILGYWHAADPGTMNTASSIPGR